MHMRFLWYFRAAPRHSLAQTGRDSTPLSASAVVTRTAATFLTRTLSSLMLRDCDMFLREPSSSLSASAPSTIERGGDEEELKRFDSVLTLNFDEKFCIVPLVFLLVDVIRSGRAKSFDVKGAGSLLLACETMLSRCVRCCVAVKCAASTRIDFIREEIMKNRLGCLKELKITFREKKQKFKPALIASCWLLYCPEPT